MSGFNRGTDGAKFMSLRRELKSSDVKRSSSKCAALDDRLKTFGLSSHHGANMMTRTRRPPAKACTKSFSTRE